MPSIPIDITILFHYNIKVDTNKPDDIIYIHAKIRLEKYTGRDAAEYIAE